MEVSVRRAGEYRLGGRVDVPEGRSLECAWSYRRALLAGDYPEKRRLAGAIGPDKPTFSPFWMPIEASMNKI
jgi:hypothetical protein